jgi:hypothetical protein
MMRKSAAVQRLARRGVAKYYLGCKFQRQLKHLPRLRERRAYAAKSEGA